MPDQMADDTMRSTIPNTMCCRALAVALGLWLGVGSRVCLSATDSKGDMRVTRLYVASNGNDAWSGTARTPTAGGGDGPFASLAGAQKAVRKLRTAGKLGGGEVVVSVAPGCYRLSETWRLEGQDSGTEAAPVTYRAEKPGTVRITGGVQLTEFRPVSEPSILKRLPEAAREAVVEADLRASGVSDYGRIAHSGFSRGEPLSHMELFINGRAMRLAEWPNRSWTRIRSVPKGKRVVDASGKPRGTDTDRFGYSGDRPKRWATLEDVWVHGYWMVDWADQYLTVKEVDTAARMVVIEPPQSGYGYKKGQRFRFLNVLEELDEEGEWYLDRSTGKLYVWPHVPVSDIDATVSVLSEPLVTLTDVEHVRLVGFILECSRSDGVRIAGGQDVVLAGCELRNLGGTGVKIQGGRGHRVRSCDIHSLGEGGILISGGDRQTLTPCGHVVANNYIHHFSRWVRTYRVGIRLTGVGIRAAHNLICDAPHAGIIYNGNNHLIEYNELTRLCQDTGDVGGIYTGRDWSARGTVIRYNYLHHLGGVNMGSNAIYLDDLASGQTIYGNIMHHVWRGLMLGGGRDNVIENNIFADFRLGIHFDARGIGWSRRLIEGRKGSWDMYGRLEKVPYNRTPYVDQYPKLASLLTDAPLEPKGNLIARNVFVGKKWLDARRIPNEHFAARGWCEFVDNLTEGDPLFHDRDGGDFRLSESSPALALRFRPIPVEQIGVQIDDYRLELPNFPQQP